MLPAPTISFTLPSIHDDNIIDCRLYLPQRQPYSRSGAGHIVRKRAGIVAHPYAPLGGSYDDPIVDLVSFSLLQRNMIVGTFNFRSIHSQPDVDAGNADTSGRGAGQSEGRTSWTARPETKDYESFIGFLVYFLHGISTQVLGFDNGQNNDSFSHDLSPIASAIQSCDYDSTRLAGRVEPFTAGVFDGRGEESRHDSIQETPSHSNEDSQPLLVLAGYSYGALITTLVPPLDLILDGFASAKIGSAEYEIKIRARRLSRQQNDTYSLRITKLLKYPDNLDEMHHTRGRTSQSTATKARVTSVTSMRTGGEDTDAETRRASHESTRSIPYRAKASFRKSIDKIRRSEQGQYGTDRIELHASQYDDSKESLTCLHRSSCHSTSKPVNDACLTLDSQADWSNEDDVGVMSIEVRYLLISPLLGLVSNLATLWTSRSQASRKSDNTVPSAADHAKLIKNKSLAVWGTKDLFTDKQKLRFWSTKLLSFENSKFQAFEVQGAGHFWHEDGVADLMAAHVSNFAGQK